jgi:hypothetical protein
LNREVQAVRKTACYFRSVATLFTLEAVSAPHRKLQTCRRGLYARVQFQMEDLSSERGHKARAYIFVQLTQKTVIFYCLFF